MTYLIGERNETRTSCTASCPYFQQMMAELGAQRNEALDSLASTKAALFVMQGDIAKLQAKITELTFNNMRQEKPTAKVDELIR